MLTSAARCMLLALALGSLLGCTVPAPRAEAADGTAPGPGSEPGSGTLASPPAAPADWAPFLLKFQEGYFALEPTFAVWAGRHEFDGRLPDFSPTGLRQKQDWLLAQRGAAAAFTAETLTPRQRFEREYLLTRIDSDLFWLRDAEWPWRNPGYYMDALDPGLYLSRAYAPPAERLKALTRLLLQMPGAAAQIRSNLRTPMPRTWVELGVNAFGGTADFLRGQVPKAFAGVRDAKLQRALREAIVPAAAAMQSLADWLKAQRGTANDDFALGPQRFAAMLRMTERVDTPLAELEATGRADLARNLAALADACAQYAPRASVAGCVARVNADKPSGGAVAGARAQLAGLRQFIVEHELVSIPSPTLALVAQAPEHKRWNFAYIDIAGPYDRSLPATYNIAPADPKWPPAEQRAYTPGRNVLLFTSAHEVWPGHFLQFMHANQGPVGFGQLFGSYAFSEGWAHYAEQMMWDAGLGNGAPAVHIGQLSEALLRDVRFICAIGLHTQGMSVASCETLFREQAFQNPANARQQAHRGSFDPGYLSYTMGKLMIMKLRADWTASHGGRAGWKAFHDQFLSYGAPPIPLVREQMMGTAGGAPF